MTWLEEAKKRAEEAAIITTDNGYAQVSVDQLRGKIIIDDAPRAYALLKRAKELIEPMTGPHVCPDLVDHCAPCSWLRDLEGKEAINA